MKIKWFTNILMTGLILFTALSVSEDLAEGQELRKVRLGTGFVPNIQFAPLYVAQKKGFYAQNGLDVQIEYGFENDFVALAAQGEREFSIASGDQIILARGQGMPITYVLKWFERFPVALVSEASKGIKTPKDLIGKTVGLPGFYGASFIGWKALLFGAGIDENAITVKQIGFTQIAALQQGIVDVAMGYIANEPVMLKNQGIPVNVIEVSDYINLVSNGLAVGDRLMKKEPELVKKMVQATLKGLIFTIENPEAAFEIARSVIPELTDEQAPVQLEVLKVSVSLWQSKKPGYSDQQAWQKSVDFMLKTGMLKKKLKVNSLYTNQFIGN
jgi:NitT/TauT family transport system substrate-binding protein